jgi:Tfp pilus assembly protein PilO
MLPLKTIKQIPSIRKHLPWLTGTAVLVMAYPWFIEPLIQTAQASGRRGHIRMLYQERLERLEQMAARQEKQRQALLSWKEEHEDLLFSPAGAEAFFSGLDQKAASLGCQVVSVEYGILPLPGTQQADPFCPVKLKGAKVLLTGRYDRLIQFLNWIESLPPCVLIDSFKVETAKDRPGILSGRIDFAVAITSGGERPANEVITGSKE